MYMKTRNFSGFKHLKIAMIDYLSSCVKSTIDIRFLTLFTDMYMKTRNFSGFKHLKIAMIDYLSSYDKFP